MKALTAVLVALLLTRLLPIWQPVWAAVSPDTEVHNTAMQTSSPITLAMTIGAGANAGLVVRVAHDLTRTVSTVTYDGVTVNAVANASGTSTGGVDMFCLAAPTQGSSKNIVVTFSGVNPGDVIVSGISFTGVDQTTPCVNGTKATGTSTTISVTVTSATGDYIVDVLANDTNNEAVSAGQTQDFRVAGVAVDDGGSHIAGAASFADQWTCTGSPHWVIAALSVKAAAGATTGHTKNVLTVGAGLQLLAPWRIIR